MAINPNTDFTAGQVLTAAQQNRFPRGIMAIGTSQTTYTLTTAETIATGMTATFTAVANRYYKVTYFEPQAQTSNAAANTTISLRLTNASGTVLNQSIFTNESAANDTSTLICVKTQTFTAGSITVVGCAKTSSTAGAPVLLRDSVREAQIIVEDLGPA